MGAEAEVPGDGHRVDRIHVQAAPRDLPFLMSGQVRIQFLEGPGRIDEQRAAGFDFLGDVELLHVCRAVAGDEVALFDEVGRADGYIAKAEMALGDAEALLRVVLEVGLGVLRGVVVDDGDRVVVRADGTVTAEAPELAADDAALIEVERALLRQGQVRDVVHDADGEAVQGFVLREVRVDRGDLRRGGVLRGQTVPAADDLQVRTTAERGADVEVERVSGGAHLLGTVEDRDGLAGLGDGGDEPRDIEGTVQVHLQEADLLAFRVQVVDDLFDAGGDGAHGHDDPLRVRCAVVVEDVVLAAGDLRDLGHVAFDHIGKVRVVRVVGFTDLEEDVRVLDRRPEHGVLGVQGMGAEGVQRVVVDEFLEVFIVHLLDFRDLVGGAEAVEEVHEGHSRLDGGQVCDRREVHDLLDAGRGDHAPAGLPAVVDVGVVAEDGQRVSADRTGRDMEDGGVPFAGDAVHGRDHQHESLGRREARGQRAGLGGAVHGGDGTGLRLHFDKADRLPEHVELSFGRPDVGLPRHRR